MHKTVQHATLATALTLCTGVFSVSYHIVFFLVDYDKGDVKLLGSLACLDDIKEISSPLEPVQVPEESEGQINKTQ